MQKKESTEFTPIEIDQFLGNLTTTPLLSSSGQMREIQVVLPGSSTLLTYPVTQFPKVFGIEYSPYLRFANTSLLNTVVKNCPWILRHTRWGDEWRHLAIQYKTELQHAAVAPLSIQWINKQIGFGLFSRSSLPKGTLVGEYTGNVRQIHRFHPHLNPYCFHYPTCFFSWNYFVIDASRIGNELRFVNHSCQPNLTPAWALDRGLLHLLLFTTRTILPGEELTFNYGNDYWLHRTERGLGTLGEGLRPPPNPL